VGDGAAVQQGALLKQAQTRARSFWMDKFTLDQGVAEFGKAGKRFFLQYNPFLKPCDRD